MGLQGLNLAIFLDLDLDPAFAHGGLQGGVVALCLVGIRDGEIAHRLVERIAGAEAK